MVNLSVIEAQLTKIGVKKTWFSKPEINELQHILMDGEDIIKCVQGRYTGGFALMVATEIRLLLIDKRPLYLTVEDIRYDMIAEVQVSSRLFDATMTIFTVNRQLAFSSTRRQSLRDLCSYVQKRVMDVRQYGQDTSSVIQPPHVQEPTPQPQPSVENLVQESPSYMPAAQVPFTSVLQNRDYIPGHLSHAIGSTATRLSSRMRKPHPYTNAPLMIRGSWSTWTQY